tara:strand:+ start:1115 stop:1345 length:231 start_codon:yes stop_codon:yes gene_type:complete
MAIVVDASGNTPLGVSTDNKLGHVSRAAATVIGNLTPAYIGEIAHDVASDTNYVSKRVDGDMNADALTNADWVAVK